LRHLLRWHLPDIDVVFCHSKRKPLRLCHVGCGDAALGLHSAGWLTRTRLYAATLASGRRFSWKLAPLANGRAVDQATVGFVGDRLYLTLLLRDPSAPDGRGPILIFSTRVPAGGS
jgi:hypothetical protein